MVFGALGVAGTDDWRCGPIVGVKDRHENLRLLLEILTHGKHDVKSVTKSFCLSVTVYLQMDLVDLPLFRVAVHFCPNVLRGARQTLQVAACHGDDLLIRKPAFGTLAQADLREQRDNNQKEKDARIFSHKAFC